eukprot:jgi/Galph1/1757/GphlegSOOS_G434.1
MQPVNKAPPPQLPLQRFSGRQNTPISVDKQRKSDNTYSAFNVARDNSDASSSTSSVEETAKPNWSSPQLRETTISEHEDVEQTNNGSVITLRPVELLPGEEDTQRVSVAATTQEKSSSEQEDSRPQLGFENFDEAQRYAIGCLVVTVLSNVLNVGLKTVVYSSTSSETIKRLSDKIQDDKLFANSFSNILLSSLGLKESAKQAILYIPYLHLGTENSEASAQETRNQCISLLGDMGSRFCAVQSLVNVAICTGKYDSRARVILQQVCSLLSIEWAKFAAIEMALALHLIENAPLDADEMEETNESTVASVSSYQQQIDDALEDAWSEEDARRRVERIRTRRRRIRVFKIGGITVAGGVVFGLTGGLIAPLLLPALAAMGLASAGTLAGTAMGTTIVGSLFGAGGAALTGKKARRRTSSRIKEFQFERADGMDPNRLEEEGGSIYSYTPGLHVCIGIPGWLGKSGRAPGSCASIFASVFEELLPCSERFALRWESKRLQQMGRAFAKFWASKTAQTLAQQAVTQLGGVFSLLAGAFLAAIAWPLTVVSVMDYIDNPWSQLISRADGAGEALADVLAERCHGNRPVTLVGFSLGARVVFKCLLSLADRRCFGIIDHAFLIGAPVTGSSSQWRKAKTVVSGRLVNAYCGTDWALTFFHRGMANSAGSVAGIRRVKVVMKAQYNHDEDQGINANDSVEPTFVTKELVENVDLAAVGVVGHKDYRNLLQRVLECVGVGTGQVSLPPAVIRSKQFNQNWVDEQVDQGKDHKKKKRKYKPPTEEQWQERHREMGTNADALLIAGDEEEAGDLFEINQDDPWNYHKETKEQSSTSKWKFSSFKNIRKTSGNTKKENGVTHVEAESIVSSDDEETNTLMAKKFENSTLRKLVTEDTRDMLMLDASNEVDKGKMNDLDSLIFYEKDTDIASSSETKSEPTLMDHNVSSSSLSKDTSKVKIIPVEEGGIPVHVGCEVAGGRLARFFSLGTQAPARRTQVFTTFGDGQTAVDIRVHGSIHLRNKARLSPLLGRKELILSKPVQGGLNVYISVSFEITETGALKVTAKELKEWDAEKSLDDVDKAVVVSTIGIFVSAEKLAEERNTQRYNAAVKIQSVWRGYIARKNYNKWKAEKVSQEKGQTK